MRSPTVVRLAPRDPIIAQREEGAELRESQLESLALDAPVIVDMGQIQLLTIPAADELAARWLLVARNQQPVVAAFFSPYPVVVETLHAALKLRRLAAYALRREPDPFADEPEVIGDLTPVAIDTLTYVRQLYDGATAREAAESLDLAAPAATNRLNDLVERGLLIAQREGRRAGAVYRYPFDRGSAVTQHMAPREEPVPA